MKKIACIIPALLLSLAAFTAVAQDGIIPKIYDVVTIEENGKTVLDLFNMPQDDQNQYYLSVGHLGIGDDLIQLEIDPLYVLFIKLGSTLDETTRQLQELRDFFKNPTGDTMQVDGVFAVGFPNEKVEPVTVTTRQILLAKKLEFSIERSGYVRATYLAKSDFASLMTSLKIYRKLHPKEQ